MTIVPAPDHIVVLYDDIYAEKTSRTVLRGIVITIGEDVTEVELNQAILFQPRSGSKVMTDTARYHIIKKEDIHGHTT